VPNFVADTLADRPMALKESTAPFSKAARSRIPVFLPRDSDRVLTTPLLRASVPGANRSFAGALTM